MKNVKYSYVIHGLALISIIGLIGYFLPAPSMEADIIYHDFIYEISMGYVLAYIFFILTVVIPEETRKRKLSYNIDIDEYEIITKLLFIFQTIFGSTLYQSKIKSGNLNQDDIELALQNKCLHKEFTWNDGYADEFEPIGEKLKELSQSIDDLISQLFVFKNYLSEEEIDNLMTIRNKIFTYDFDLDKFMYQLRPKYQNLIFMGSNFYELYKLYMEIQKILFSRKVSNRNIYFDKILYLYYSEQYKELLNFIKKNTIILNDSDKQWVNKFCMLAKYKLGNKIKSHEMLVSELNKKLDIVSWRNIIIDMYDDEVKEILNKYADEKDVKMMLSILENERQIYEVDIKKKQYIKENYRNEEKISDK